MASAAVIAADLLQNGRDKGEAPYIRRANGWTFGYSDGEAGGINVHVFSASLYPRSRGSTDADWRYLGEITGALGIPEDGLRQIAEQVETDPTLVFKAIWT